MIFLRFYFVFADKKQQRCSPNRNFVTPVGNWIWETSKRWKEWMWWWSPFQKRLLQLNTDGFLRNYWVLLDMNLAFLLKILIEIQKKKKQKTSTLFIQQVATTNTTTECEKRENINFNCNRKIAWFASHRGLSLSQLIASLTYTHWRLFFSAKAGLQISKIKRKKTNN